MPHRQHCAPALVHVRKDQQSDASISAASMVNDEYLDRETIIDTQKVYRACNRALTCDRCTRWFICHDTSASDTTASKRTNSPARKRHAHFRANWRLCAFSLFMLQFYTAEKSAGRCACVAGCAHALWMQRFRNFLQTRVSRERAARLQEHCASQAS